jgi:hypothetical protein
MIALSASGTYGSSDQKATDIQGNCPPPNARLAKTSMVPAGHRHKHQIALPAASPWGSLETDTTTESFLASPSSRSELASRRAPVPADPALTRFSFDGRDTESQRHPIQKIWANAMVYVWISNLI